ncbi:MAG: anaerobic ribonucleoside-triphosphate reductase [Clostridiales bacterium]|nr:anaerobic ribonucleoside-triphosphate reductase [Clostridiales bacterium]
MLKQNKNDNASNRKSYVGKVYNIGEKEIKKSILDSLNPEWAKKHKEGYIHIHDLDAYGLTYNCLTFDILNAFPYSKYEGLSEIEKIISTFDFIKELVAKMGNEQSGGMSFANFDNDFATIFTNMNVNYKDKKDIFAASIRSLIIFCNNMHTRMGQTSYYVTFNIGLANNDFARFLAFTLIDEFYKSGSLVYKPNIVFKVHKGISRNKEDNNYDLLEKALLCTAKKMIPTYLLCDCEADKNIDPSKLSIMGCRTRVVDDLYGKQGAIGRSNIDNISINLPRLALESVRDCQSADIKERYETLKEKWKHIAELTKDILLDRFEKTCNSDKDLFPTNLEYNLWCEDFNTTDLKEIFKHGTLSIGFIGLTETVEIITGKKYWKDNDAYKLALDFVKFMRNYVDSQKEKYHLNFSLLATSGELISGRFVKIDKKIFDCEILKKDYYTNSFHVDVDSKIPAYRKIQYEGPFHIYANGGCITYVELAEAPLGNAVGLDELVEIAIESGVHYLGFNFPKDVCADCGTTGTFDYCPECGSHNITRIRRVSGYLEIQDFFTSGKMKESQNRKTN